MANLQGRKIAILATDGVEQVELTEPAKALRQAEADVTLIALHGDEIQAMNHAEKGDKLKPDKALPTTSPEQFDALLLPGGVANPDRLRVDPDAVAFVAHFVEAGKPIAAICHGPWMLIEAGAVDNRTVTSWPSLQTDLRNAGAKWVDREVVVDGNLVTSRKPDDIPAFNREMIRVFSRAAEHRAA